LKKSVILTDGLSMQLPHDEFSAAHSASHTNPQNIHTSEKCYLLTVLKSKSNKLHDDNHTVSKIHVTTSTNHDNLTVSVQL